MAQPSPSSSSPSSSPDHPLQSVSTIAAPSGSSLPSRNSSESLSASPSPPPAPTEPVPEPEPVAAASDATQVTQVPPGTHREHPSSTPTPPEPTMTTTTTTKYPFPVPPPPAPIPLPEPVHHPRQSSDTAQHQQGPTRSSSSRDSPSPPRTSADLHGSPDRSSPSSPKEINHLLGGTNSHSNNNSTNNSDVAPLTMGPRRPRPHHIPSTTTNLSVGSRYSAADAYVTRPHSSYSFNGSYPGPGPGPGSGSGSSSSQDSRPPSVVRQRSSQFIPSPLGPNVSLRTRPNSTTSRPPSMVLYRLAGLGDDELKFQHTASLAPPPPIASSGSVRTHRVSMYSTTGSMFSEASSSKYPSRQGGDETPGTPPSSGAFLPYEYDPTDDLEKPDDAEDELHTPDPVGTREKISIFNSRGFANVLAILILLLGLITLFLVYPILSEKNIALQSNLLFGTSDGRNDNSKNDANTDTNTDSNTNTQHQSS